MNTTSIAIAVQKAYSAALDQPGIGYLVLDETGIIVWMDNTCADLLHTTATDACGNTLMRLLPEETKPRHNRLVAGVFEGFRRAIANKDGTAGRQSMRKPGPDGKTPPVKAFDWKGSPIELLIEFAPVIVSDILYAVAFVELESEMGGSIVQAGPEIRQASEIVIQNSQVRILSDLGTVMDKVGGVVGKQYNGVFGFYVKNVFGDSRPGRIFSWLFAALSWAAITSTLLGGILWGASIIFAKPTYQNLQIPIGEPLEPPTPNRNNQP